MVVSDHKTHLFYISLRGNFKETGFGFSCMKQAYKKSITGQLHYTSTQKIEMHLEGGQEQVEDFFSWCMESGETSEGKLSSPMVKTAGFNDFKIINSL